MINWYNIILFFIIKYFLLHNICIFITNEEDSLHFIISFSLNYYFINILFLTIILKTFLCLTIILKFSFVYIYFSNFTFKNYFKN